MVKCEICNSNIQELFFKKIKGTIIKDENGKTHTICFECQSKLRTKKEQLEKMPL